MKYSKIALACGLAVAAMSAQAVDLNTLPNFTGAKKIFLSGATAPDNFLGDIASGMLTGEIAIRSTDSGILHRAYFGPAGASIPNVTAGTNIVFIKRSKGGSVWGVDPVARGQRVETLDFTNCTALTVALPTQPYSYSCGVKGVDPVSAADLGAADSFGKFGEVPDFGVSDVEPALFKTPYNTENGLPALSGAELGKLSNKGVNQIMMGIVATDAVPATTHISRSQYGAMLAGKLADWSQVIPGDTSSVVVCRRVNGSGTQTSYNWFFTGFPCNNASLGSQDTPPAGVADSFGYNATGLNLALATVGTAANPIIVDPTAGLTIVENSGSGDVRNCLKAAQNNTDFTVTGSNSKVYKVTFSGLKTGTTVNPAKAIGVLSLDSYNNANTAGSGFSFRHLDGAGTFNGATQTSSAGATGIAPSKANLLAGKYDFVVELSMQARNAASGAGTAITADSVKNAFYKEFVNRAGQTKYTGNDGGTFTTVPNAFATLPTTASYDLKPAFVSKFSRGGNTCAPLVSFPSL